LSKTSHRRQQQKIKVKIIEYIFYGEGAESRLKIIRRNKGVNVQDTQQTPKTIINKKTSHNFQKKMLTVKNAVWRACK
jgi:hypothetical protein